MTLEDDLKTLQRLPTLKGIDVKKLKLIALVAERVGFEPGEMLYRQGDPPDTMFITLGGRLTVLIERDGREEELWHFTGPTMLGQVGILSGHARGVSIRAETEMCALKLSADDFTMLIRDVHSFAVAVMRELALQIEATTRQDTERSRSEVA